MKRELVKSLRAAGWYGAVAFISVSWHGAPTHAVDADDIEVCAVIPRATTRPTIDGNLTEYDEAFCTPVEYFNRDQRNRPGQFYYLWDDEAFYVGVRTLDEHPFSPLELFWVGDAVEWYFDTRRGSDFMRGPWGKGAVHCFFTGLKETKVEPRFTLRPGFENAIPKTGVQVASQRTGAGMEIEFKLPWVNFPDFHPADGQIIALDAELSYSDGISRSFRTFAFGGPLSVETPANLARVKLVDKFRRSDWHACGPVMMPIRIDVPWEQQGSPRVEGLVAMPPNRSNEVGRVVLRITDSHGRLLGEFLADEEQAVGQGGNFIRRIAHWPTALAAPGSYFVEAIVYGHDDEELTRVTPRLVSVNMDQGY